MRRPLPIFLLAANAVLAVACFATGHLIVGFGCVGAGLGLLGASLARARPSRWTPADTDQSEGSGR